MNSTHTDDDIARVLQEELANVTLSDRSRRLVCEQTARAWRSEQRLLRGLGIAAVAAGAVIVLNLAVLFTPAATRTQRHHLVTES
ncbi:MAG: hypothetical protein ACOC0O_06805, partial [Spirochaetota bacterium]